MAKSDTIGSHLTFDGEAALIRALRTTGIVIGVTFAVWLAWVVVAGPLVFNLMKTRAGG